MDAAQEKELVGRLDDQALKSFAVVDEAPADAEKPEKIEKTEKAQAEKAERGERHAAPKAAEAKAEAENIINKYKTEANPNQLLLLPGAATRRWRFTSAVKASCDCSRVNCLSNS